MTTFRKKLPIEVDHKFMCYIAHRFSREERLFIVPEKYPGANKIAEKETYWLSEKYAIINDSFIAYQSDYISRDDFDWKPADTMVKSQARYGFECCKIENKKLKAVTKSELLKSGVASEAFPSQDDEGIPKEFASRPKEFWRFRKRWESLFEDFQEWDDKTEVLIFHFQVHRFKPELPIYNWHVQERLNYQTREQEFKIRMAEESEKGTEDEKNGRKKKKTARKTRKK